MEHSRVRELLSDYLDGELEQELAGQLENHLKECEACRFEFRALEKTMAAVARLEPVRAPDDFAAKVHLRLRRRLRHRPERATSLEHKIPYETICLIMLAILAALYIILYLLPLMDVDMSYKGPEPGKKPDRTAPRSTREEKQDHPSGRSRPVGTRPSGPTSGQQPWGTR